MSYNEYVFRGSVILFLYDFSEYLTENLTSYLQLLIDTVILFPNDIIRVLLYCRSVMGRTDPELLLVITQKPKFTKTDNSISIAKIVFKIHNSLNTNVKNTVYKLNKQNI